VEGIEVLTNVERESYRNTTPSPRYDGVEVAEWLNFNEAAPKYGNRKRDNGFEKIDPQSLAFRYPI
jgi:hypothetical protein